MKVLRNRISEISIDAHGILNIKISKNKDVDLNDVIDTFLKAKLLTKGLPSLVVIDLRHKRRITHAAKKLILKENVPTGHIAKAVIVNSSLSKNFHDFLIRFKSARFPVRKFVNEKDAFRWLKAGSN